MKTYIVVGCGTIACGAIEQLLRMGNQVVVFVRDSNRGETCLQDMKNRLVLTTMTDSSINPPVETTITTNNTDHNKEPTGFTFTKRKSSPSKQTLTSSKEQLSYIVADLGSKKSCREAVISFVERFRLLDGLFCFAGEGPTVSATQKTIEGENRVFATNFLGIFILSHYLMPYLKQDGLILYTVGDQSSYADIPDNNNFYFKQILPVGSASSRDSTTGGGGAGESLERKSSTRKGRKKGASSSTTTTTTTTNANNNNTNNTNNNSYSGGNSGNGIPSPYSAAKVALYCTAVEYAKRFPSVRIVLFNPGLVKSRFHKDSGQHIPDECFTANSKDISLFVEWVLTSAPSIISQKSDLIPHCYGVKLNEIPLVDSPKCLKFGNRHEMDSKAQEELVNALIEHVGLSKSNGRLDLDQSIRSIKSASSSTASKEKGILSKCLLM